MFELQMNIRVIVVSILIFYTRGYVPGVKSIKKCNEIHNVRIFTRLVPQTQETFDSIRKFESGYIPEEAFIGGYNAKPKQLRFIAALGYGSETEKMYLCGGSLISENFVITAAHCVFSKFLGLVKYVRLGDLNLTSTEDNIGVQELEASERHVHPNYKYPQKYHDIALIKLNKPAVLNEYVMTICLQPQRTSLIFTTLFAAGWGALGYEGELSSHLQLGELRFFYIEDCRAVYNTSAVIPQGIVDDMQICAGGENKISDTCRGDSGGPLFYFNDDYCAGVEYLTGIISFGKPCGLAKIPGVYARVSYYVEWIEKIVWPD